MTEVNIFIVMEKGDTDKIIKAMQELAETKNTDLKKLFATILSGFVQKHPEIIPGYPGPGGVAIAHSKKRKSKST